MGKGVKRTFGEGFGTVQGNRASGALFKNNQPVTPRSETRGRLFSFILLFFLTNLLATRCNRAAAEVC